MKINIKANYSDKRKMGISRFMVMPEETETIRKGKSEGKIEGIVIETTIIMCRGCFSVHN